MNEGKTNPVGLSSAVDKLQQRLGVDWPTIVKARKTAALKRQDLREALDSCDSEDTSIVVFGSLAGDEFTSGSDIDWTLLVDGFASPEHQETAAEIHKYIDVTESRRPGREGTFGGLAFSHELLNNIGGADDTNRNMTQRILLMLESAAIGRSDAYERVLRNVLSRYVHEDYGLIHSVARHNVPRFLQNDIARYWRTVAIDFAYKQRKRGDGWALRAAKLRLSRKLLYASGLLMCFSCHFAMTRDPLPSGDQAEEGKLHPIVEHLLKYSRMSPLEVVADTFFRYPDLDTVARKLFDTYDKFLSLLDDEAKRDHLESLTNSEVASDPVYQYARELGHDFQECLDKVFLEQNDSQLYELTKVYGVF